MRQGFPGVENSGGERIYLSPHHMGGEEMRFVNETFGSNYIAPLEPMVDASEKECAEKVSIKYSVAVSSGTCHILCASGTGR